MTILLVLGCCLFLAGIGAFIGVWLGDREGGDYNIAPVLYGLAGIAIGAVAGTIVGSILSEILLK